MLLKCAVYGLAILATEQIFLLRARSFAFGMDAIYLQHNITIKDFPENSSPHLLFHPHTIHYYLNLTIHVR